MKLSMKRESTEFLSKMDTFGTIIKHPSKCGVHLIMSNKGSKEKQGPTQGVHFSQVSVL